MTHNKELYFIRHGYALHNKMYNLMGETAYTEFPDTSLVEQGVNEAKYLNSDWVDINNIELVVVSPLTRTLETYKYIFANTNDIESHWNTKNVIAKDFLLEYPLGGDEYANKRKNISDLQLFYKEVNFDIINEMPDWNSELEDVNELINRQKAFMEWIHHRPEKKIAIVGHSSWMGQFLYGSTITDPNLLANKIKHCIPYKVIFQYDDNNVYIRKWISNSYDYIIGDHRNSLLDMLHIKEDEQKIEPEPEPEPVPELPVPESPVRLDVSTEVNLHQQQINYDRQQNAIDYYNNRRQRRRHPNRLST